MPLKTITLTGADERTNIRDLVQLVEREEVEIGLLYTATPEGRNRYPGRSWLLHAATALSGRCAIHVCGRTARAELLDGSLGELAIHAPRFQVNGVVTAAEVVKLASRVGTLITQHTASNAPLLSVDVPNHALLVDGSGGQGISPELWCRPESKKRIGFAGGLGSGNIRTELPLIAAVAEGDWWVDMEGKLRTDDWFDIDKARAVLDAVFPAHQPLAGL